MPPLTQRAPRFGEEKSPKKTFTPTDAKILAMDLLHRFGEVFPPGSQLVYKDMGQIARYRVIINKPGHLQMVHLKTGRRFQIKGFNEETNDAWERVLRLNLPAINGSKTVADCEAIANSKEELRRAQLQRFTPADAKALNPKLVDAFFKHIDPETNPNAKVLWAKSKDDPVLLWTVGINDGKDMLITDPFTGNAEVLEDVRNKPDVLRPLLYFNLPQVNNPALTPQETWRRWFEGIIDSRITRRPKEETMNELTPHAVAELGLEVYHPIGFTTDGRIVAGLNPNWNPHVQHPELPPVTGEGLVEQQRFETLFTPHSEAAEEKLAEEGGSKFVYIHPLDMTQVVGDEGEYENGSFVAVELKQDQPGAGGEEAESWR